ncbi:MAG: glycosyltransferase family 2 protein [Acidobacteria bacterium]|nr:glycosyltransferase family 2 protein [Acidobacteriota bacterium]MCZ6747386.1 glycosyltransferase family 2 protein [Acidobacteriota bacterium]
MPTRNGAAVGLSIVIPAFNEAGRIAASLCTILEYLAAEGHDGEIIVVDDGSRDTTVEVVRGILGDGGPHQLLTGRANRGKGFSVREGALAATRPWTLLSDADLSTPIAEVDRLLTTAVEEELDLVMGSRALAGSRIGVYQGWLRRNMGRSFNLVMRAITGLPFKDTQCGFKLWRTESIRPLLGRLTIDGFAWDVELLVLARRAGLRLAEVPVEWNDVEGSKVAMVADPLRMLRDLVRVRLRR